MAGDQQARAASLVLVLMVAAAFGRVVGNQFLHWDDPAMIFQNPKLHPVTFANVVGEWTHAEHGEYLPVTRTVWAVLALGARTESADPDYPPGVRVHLNAQVFHLASVAAHAGTALAVFGLLVRLFGRTWAAFAGAALFAVHPVQVESVAWASGLKDVLCGLFGMLALWQYAAYVQGAELPSWRRRMRYACATLFFILSVLSKPTGVVVPALALVIDGLLLRRGQWGRMAWALAPWFVVSLAAGVLARSVMPSEGVPTTPLWARPLIVGDAVSFYLYKLAWPAALAADYGRRPAAVMAWAGVWVVWVVPVALLLAAGWLAWKKKQFTPLAALLLFAGGAGPVLGFMPHMFQYFSTTADHYLYLSMLGPGLLLTWGVTKLDRANWKWSAVAIGLVLLALGVRSALQAGHWRDSRTFWEHTLAVNPRSFVGYGAIGELLILENRLDEAESALRKAIEVNPDYAPPHATLYRVMLARGRLDEAVALKRRYMQIVRNFPGGHRPDLAAEHLELGAVLMAQRRYAEAAREFERALELRPGLPGAGDALGQARRMAASTRPGG